MEPFRPVVDDFVLKMNLDGDELDKDDKQHILRMLECNVVIDNERRTLLEAMKKYTRCALNAICTSDTSQLRFFRYEF